MINRHGEFFHRHVCGNPLCKSGDSYTCYNPYCDQTEHCPACLDEQQADYDRQPEMSRTEENCDETIRPVPEQISERR